MHQNVPEAFLVAEGLTNYWGYNTIGFFAPHNGYSAAVRAGQPGGQVAEFKAMVDALHQAGLEVILDVVFNHTAEAGPDGPTLCFRGLDNLAYYRIEPGDPGVYYDTTGCGNSLNAGDPITLQLMMDSLRYWLTEMHADGFRFDLAPTLARQDGAFDKVSAFLDMCSQDPVVSRAKLVAEPWDVGQMDSYDLGRFPPLWREWNGKYRDTMRDFWRSHPVGIGEFANRFTGSADLYATAGRRPTASVNLITVHDGFTLAGPGLLRRQAQRGQRREQPRRDQRQQLLELRRRRPHRRPRHPRAARPPIPGHAHHADAVLRRPDAAGRRRAGPHPGRQQQRLLPGQRDDLVRLGQRRHRAAGLHQAAHRLPARAPGLPPRGASWPEPRPPSCNGSPPRARPWTAPTGPTRAPGPSPSTSTGPTTPTGPKTARPMLDDDFLVLVNSWWEPLSFVLPPVRPGAQWQAEIDSYDPAAPAGSGSTPGRRPGDRRPPVHRGAVRSAPGLTAPFRHSSADISGHEQMCAHEPFPAVPELKGQPYIALLRALARAA